MMPRLAIGKLYQRSILKIRGFTLLELLVVMLIIGIVTSSLSLSNTDRSQQSMLHEEAIQLIHTFELLDEESELRFMPLAWISDHKGWKIIEKDADGWRVSSLIKPHLWENTAGKMQISIEGNQPVVLEDFKFINMTDANYRLILFNRHTRDQIFQLKLQFNHHQKSIARSIEGRYVLLE